MIARMFPLLVVIALASGCAESPQPAADSDSLSSNNVPAADSASGDGETAPQPAESAAPVTEDEPGAEENPDVLKKDGVTAEVASWDEVQQFVKQQQGKVVVLDAWSTWCVPCLREFPHLVALQKEFPDKVVCVSFNLNYAGIEDEPPQAAAEQIMTELVKQDAAKVKNFISSTADSEFYDQVDLASIPAVFVYGPDGKLAKRFDNDEEEYGKGGFTYDKQIIPLIEKLLPAK